SRFTVAADDGSLWLKSLLDLLLRGPPVWPLDLGHALADELFGRLDVVETAGVVPEELGLVGLAQLALPHRLDGPPRVVPVVVVDIRRPGQDVLVELGQARRGGLVTLKAGDAVLQEGLAGQALQGRQLALVAVELVD